MKKIRLFFLMLAVTVTSAAYAQDITVSGNVTEASTGEPLVGATVFVEGTTTGATTDADGHYSISVSADGELTVSMIGYVSQTIAVDGRTVIEVRAADTSAMRAALNSHLECIRVIQDIEDLTEMKP